MIPRTLHYCWLSDDSLDAVSEQCLRSWQQHLGEYQLRLWDRESCPDGVPFLDRMLASRQWAYASDYLRLHALYSEGGIYLDLDVEVFRSFDSLLAQRAFISIEDETDRRIAGHVLAAEPGHPFIAQCLEFYRTSVRLRLSAPPTIPRVLTSVARRELGYSRHADGGTMLEDGVFLHPVRTFTPLSFRERSLSSEDRRTVVGDDTYALHHWNHGWSWLDEPLHRAVPRIPWLFMGPGDWRFVLRHLIARRFRRGGRRKAADSSR